MRARLARRAPAAYDRVMRFRLLAPVALCPLALAAAPAHATSPPLPAAAVADVTVAMTASDAQTVPSLGPAVSPVTYTVVVTNDGPDGAAGIHLRVELTGDQPVQEVTPQRGTCGGSGAVVTCDTDAIPAGQSDTIQVRTIPASTSDLGARANATTLSTDPRPANNFAGATPDVVVADPQPPPPPTDDSAPDTNISAPGARPRRGSFRLVEGTAIDVGTGVARVEVALQRVDRGACTSLVNSRGRFTRRPCGTRTWLRASGKGRWRYRLKRSLPAGTYRVYSRATDGAGLTETSFTRADRNAVRFKVR